MSRLNPEQAEQLQEIGAYLRLHRQKLSRSTEEVAAKTFIQSRLLKALEEGQLDQLPEPVFIQGFIRRYADALNLDGAALAKTFPLSSLPVQSETSNLEAFKELPKNDSALSTEKIGQKWRSYLNTSSQTLSRVRVPYVIYLLLGVALATGSLYLLNRPRTAKVDPQHKNSPATPQQTTVAKSAPKSSASSKASNLNTPIKVTLSLNDESWLRVSVDGKTKFEGILNKGNKQTWAAKKQVTVRAGNAGAVLISLNQRDPEPIGNVGEVKEVKFTPAQR